MAHGKVIGFVDENFSARIDELQERARVLANQFRNLDTFRPWATPTVFRQNNRDVLDVPALDEPTWNRNKINSAYSEQALKAAGSEGGVVGDLMALKWQGDFMAVEERAFRLRHASYARCASVMHGRLNGHGNYGENVFTDLRTGVQTIIANSRANAAEDNRETA